MRYHDITTDDMLNGDGLRTVLWVAGCGHRCEGCHNPITWDESGGVEFDEEAERELFENLDKPHISGITFSGGDPLFPGNRSEVERLVKKCREKAPDKTIWIYTGYLWEEVKDLESVKNADVLVDGKFVKELADPKLHWKGSSNQRVVDVQESLSGGEVVLHKT